MQPQTTFLLAVNFLRSCLRQQVPKPIRQVQSVVVCTCHIHPPPLPKHALALWVRVSKPLNDTATPMLAMWPGATLACPVNRSFPFPQHPINQNISQANFSTLASSSNEAKQNSHIDHYVRVNQWLGPNLRYHSRFHDEKYIKIFLK